MLLPLCIPELYKCQISVPIDKIFDLQSPVSNAVQSIQWYASLKPTLADVEPVKTAEIRYEEIQIFEVTLRDATHLFEIVHTMQKSIKYPCLLCIEHNNKSVLSASPFRPGKRDYDDNVLRSVNLSHWIHADLLSPEAESLLNTVNEALSAADDLYSIYTRITHAIQMFSLGGLTKAHVRRLLRDMVGKLSEPEQDAVLQYCTPYQKHYPMNSSMAAKYNKAQRSSSYVYSFDTEDLWYCFQKYEPTRRVILGRRYRNMQDLIFSIDSKIEGSRDLW